MVAQWEFALSLDLRRQILSMDQATLSAILNTPRSIFQLATTELFLAGNMTSPAVAASTILSTQAGWIANIQVLAAGSSPGFIYNAPSFSSMTNATKLMPIQNSIGLQHGFVNFNNGMIVVPGPGQLVNITYSLQQQQVTT